MGVIGEEINEAFATQINARQILQGSGKTSSSERTNTQIQVLNAQSSFIKLASGVSVDGEKLSSLGFTSGSLSYSNNLNEKLAKNNILFGGNSKFSPLSSETGSLSLRQNFTSDGAYEKGDFGIVPQPGIENINVRNLNRGSIKKATIQLKAHSKKQFDIIETLYMRLGYTVLLEWGNNIYTTNGKNKVSQDFTLIEKGFFANDVNFNSLLQDIITKRGETYGNYDGMLGKISNFEWKYGNNGTYDITLTLVSIGDVIESLKLSHPTPSTFDSFFKTLDQAKSTSFTGMIANRGRSMLHTLLWCLQYIDKTSNVTKFDRGSIVVQNDDGGNSNRLLHGIGSFVNPKVAALVGKFSVVTVNFALENYDPEGVLNGGIINKNFYTNSRHSPNEITMDGGKKLVWTRNGYTVTYSQQDINNDPNIANRGEIVKALASWAKTVATSFESDRGIDTTDAAIITSITGEIANSSTRITSTTTKEEPDLTIKVTNPIKSIEKIDVASVIGSGEENRYYLRLGGLLSYIHNQILPNYVTKIGKEEKIIDIRYTYNIGRSNMLGHKTDWMYHPPLHASYDPSVCIVESMTKPFYWSGIYDTGPYAGAPKPKVGLGPFDFSECWMYNGLAPFGYDFFKDHLPLNYSNPTETFGRQRLNVANLQNIYLNFDFLEKTFTENTTEVGDVHVYPILKAICDGINKSMGGVNKLEPIIDERLNQLQIVDTTPIPGRVKQFKDLTTKYNLNLFGYKNNGNESNFVRKLDIQTAITPDFATMITVGATAGGYTKGENSTAFSKWNKGISDRFKDELAEPDPNVKLEFPPSEVTGFYNAVVKYWELVLYGAYEGDGEEPKQVEGNGAGSHKPIYELIKDGATFNSTGIAKAISRARSFFTYALAKKSSINLEGKTTGGIGFIPFKLKFDIDGFSGFKIYNVIHTITDFLPKAYGDTLDFITTGVEHKIQNNDWVTTIQTTLMPKSAPSWNDFSTTPANIEKAQKLSSAIPHYSYLLDQAALDSLEARNNTTVTVTGGVGVSGVSGGSPASVGGTGTGGTAFTLGTQVTGDHVKNAFNTEAELDLELKSSFDILDTL